MHILVTGATGAVGPQIVAALSAAGHHIRCLSLDTVRADRWPQNVEARTGDITQCADVHAAMDKIDAVVHLAALLHIVDPAPEMRSKYEAVNVGGTNTVMEAAVAAGVRRVVYFSTTAVYGHSHGGLFNEQSPPNPRTFYEVTKYEAEKVVLSHKTQAGQPIGTVLRMAAIYGSRIKGNYRRMLKALDKGLFLPIGNGRNRRTLIYDKDAARAVVLALEEPGAAGKIFNASDNGIHTLNDIIAAMCTALGRKRPSFSVPIGPVRFAAGIVESASKLLSVQAPIRRAMIDKYLEDSAIDNRRIQSELGFVPNFSLTAGWKDTVQEMRNAGEL